VELMMKLVVVLCLLAHAAHGDDEIDIEGRASTALRGNAMIWEDAALYLEPWDSGAMLRVSSLGRGRRDEVGRAIPIRIVSAALRDFVEIELVGDSSCTWRRLASDTRISGLRLFVKRDDLAPVLARPFAITYPNGTSARVAPGVPVMPTASGAYVLAARGDVLRLPIPHRSVGFTYPRTRVEDPPPPKGELWRLEQAAPVRLGDDSFEARANWLAAMPAKHGDTVNLRWRTKCIDLVVGVPAKALRKLTIAHGHGGGYGHGQATFAQSIPRGTPLSTPGGREVGVAAEAIGVPPPVDGMACFEAQLRLWRLDDKSSSGRTFKLCAPATALDGPAAN
jgi:hypothetical protein